MDEEAKIEDELNSMKKDVNDRLALKQKMAEESKDDMEQKKGDAILEKEDNNLIKQIKKSKEIEDHVD